MANSNIEIIPVAVGIIIRNSCEVLIAKRPPQVTMPGLWEFPGGKIEHNEAVYAALCRELYEEIGVQVVAAQPWKEITYAYSDRIVQLHNWLVTEFTGVPYGKENQVVQWMAIEKLDRYEFPPANLAAIQLLMSTYTQSTG